MIMSKAEGYFKKKMEGKTPPSSLPVSFNKRKKYIMFPWQGLIHWIALTILFVFCVNYNNNLGIAGVCFLAVYYMVSIFRNFYAITPMKLISIKRNDHDENKEGVITFVFTYPIKKDEAYPLFWLNIANNIIPIEFKKGVAVVAWNYGNLPAGTFNLPIFSVLTYWPSAITRSWIYARSDLIFSIAPGNDKNADNSSGDDLKRSSANFSPSYQGDVDGIREVLPSERVSKISWKHSMKQKKLMTYTWEDAKKSSVLIKWPPGEESNIQKARKVRSEIDRAIVDDLSYQISHPVFLSAIGKGEKFGVSSLCKLMERVVETYSMEDVLNSKGKSKKSKS